MEKNSTANINSRTKAIPEKFVKQKEQKLLNLKSQAQKLHKVISKFQKHRLYKPMTQCLKRLQMFEGLSQIYSYSENNLFTMTQFRENCLIIFKRAYLCCTQDKDKFLLNTMRETLICYIQETSEEQFRNQLRSIQKSFDNIYEQALNHKKRIPIIRHDWKDNQSYKVKNLGNLIRELPQGYLAGVWEIASGRPISDFKEGPKKLAIDLKILSDEKLSEIQRYVQKTIKSMKDSRESKKLKLMAHPEKYNKKKKYMPTQKELNEENSNSSSQRLTSMRNPEKEFIAEAKKNLKYFVENRSNLDIGQQSNMKSVPRTQKSNLWKDHQAGAKKLVDQQEDSNINERKSHGNQSDSVISMSEDLSSDSSLITDSDQSDD